ncbi:hypothetical protein [Burkholderia plantarii]|uniref:hypothetical protein n=1 Tax=Burkholderia plantarii TaxID=41899 RepID=UPI003556AB83
MAEYVHREREREAAESAKNANQIASGAVEPARSGDAAVTDAARTMEAAVDESEHIVGIALQTNILALNAATSHPAWIGHAFDRVAERVLKILGVGAYRLDRRVMPSAQLAGSPPTRIETVRLLSELLRPCIR